MGTKPGPSKQSLAAAVGTTCRVIPGYRRVVGAGAGWDCDPNLNTYYMSLMAVDADGNWDSSATMVNGGMIEVKGYDGTELVLYDYTDLMTNGVCSMVARGVNNTAPPLTLSFSFVGRYTNSNGDTVPFNETLTLTFTADGLQPELLPPSS